ncbi:DUF2177 family protein [Phenylobacterium immobile]|uniref:DUF2177 family protein n=1 Tax=Phenylobacterium immobile TaxID=21 RepID=UPI000B241364|nr:DUF2177 family protein [Phenylobacterium immobile]
MAYVAAYLAAGVVFALLDGVWLTLAGPRLYQPILGELLAPKPRLGVAVIFYLTYILGIVLLAIAPTRDEAWTRTALTGAMLGAMAYATYDLTNQATLKVWSTKITLMDIGWGAFVTAAGAIAGVMALRWAERTF